MKTRIKNEEVPEYVKIRPINGDMDGWILTLGKTLLSPWKFSTEAEAKKYATSLHIEEMIALISELDSIKEEMNKK